MAPSTNRKVSLPDLVRRFWMGMVIQPLILGLVILGLTLGTDNTISETSPHEVANLQQPRLIELHTKRDMPSLPLPVQIPAQVGQSQVTRATLTGHNLTAAHFFGRPAPTTVLVETNNSLDKS